MVLPEYLVLIAFERVSQQCLAKRWRDTWLFLIVPRHSRGIAKHAHQPGNSRAPCSRKGAAVHPQHGCDQHSGIGTHRLLGKGAQQQMAAHAVSDHDMRPGMLARPFAVKSGQIGNPNRKIAGMADKGRSEEHTSELQSLMRISYAVFCLKKKNNTSTKDTNESHYSSVPHKK